MSTARIRQTAEISGDCGLRNQLRVISPPVDRELTQSEPPADAPSSETACDGELVPAGTETAGTKTAGTVDGEPDARFLDELASASESLEQAAPREILQWAIDRYAPHFTMATAFGPEGMTLIHLLAELAPDTPIFNLDTGYQFRETLELREKVLHRYGIAVRLVKPELSIEEYEARNGGPVYQQNPDRCCWDRKIGLLRGAITGMQAWASAIRRDQSPDRAAAPIVGWDKKFHLVKVSPLANWTKQEVWKLITDHDIPYNPLHDRGYPSVGCRPCTRAVLLGQDERSGRWSGMAKTECGLHSLND